MADKALDLAAAVKAAFEDGYYSGVAAADVATIETEWVHSESKRRADAHAVEHGRQMTRIRKRVNG